MNCGEWMRTGGRRIICRQSYPRDNPLLTVAPAPNHIKAMLGGGVGEHMPQARARALAGLRWAGIEVDPAANAVACGRVARISPAGGRVAVWTVTVAEEPIRMRETLSVPGDTAPKART